MKENTLLKIALICSLVGLVILYLISTRMDVKESTPIELGSSIGDELKLKGTVTKITGKADAIFIEVNQQSPITVVLFTDNGLKLREGDSIEVIGELQEYKGKKEVIAQKIRVIG